MWALFAFYTLSLIFVYLIRQRIRHVSRCIRQGRPYVPNTSAKTRWKNTLRIAFGQSKMFNRWGPAFLHSLIYMGFILINIELLEILWDGATGTHRSLSDYLGGAYAPLISFLECLSIGVLVACAAFWIRRDAGQIKRLSAAELKGQPNWDARLILLFEALLMIAFLNMNATDRALQAIGADNYPITDPFLVSQHLMFLYANCDSTLLRLLERGFWWAHLCGIFGFALYVTYSKHLHIVLAFPAVYYRRHRNADGQPQMPLMDDIYAEVRTQLGLGAPSSPQPNTSDSQQAPARTFGAKDTPDLSWKNLLDAYACSECGRCSDHCPATQTGKALSPRRIMMQTRRRANEKIKHPERKKTLLYEYIRPEEVFACTTCQACQMACPMDLDPLAIILAMRRYLMMESNEAPQAWMQMIDNVEQSSAPWRFDASTRMAWLWKRP